MPSHALYDDMLHLEKDKNIELYWIGIQPARLDSECFAHYAMAFQVTG